MTEIEAIKQLKMQRTFTYGSDAKVLNMAINALEKQIPKKPKMRHIEKYDRYNDGWCSCCEAYVIEESNKNFCSECGQKLDWSDGE